jgi:hypothetical protein
MRNIKLSVAVIGLLYTTNASAIEMTDYKVVDGYYQDAYLNGQLNINSGNQEQTSYNAHFDANLRTVKTTLPYSWDYKILGNSDFSQGKHDKDDSLDSYDATAVAHFDKYLNDGEKFFMYGSGRLGYQKVANADSADDPYTEVGEAVGYGRVYNAKPIAKEFRIIEEELKIEQ